MAALIATATTYPARRLAVDGRLASVVVMGPPSATADARKATDSTAGAEVGAPGTEDPPCYRRRATSTVSGTGLPVRADASGVAVPGLSDDVAPLRGVEQRRDVVRGVERLGVVPVQPPVTVLVVAVLAVVSVPVVRAVAEQVADDQERPSGCDRRGEPSEQRGTVGPARVQVVRGDQVVGTLGRRPGLEVGVQPLDPVAEAAGVGQRGGTLQGDGREVHRGDPPAPLGEPSGVAALAGSGVQRRAGRQRRSASTTSCRFGRPLHNAGAER